MKMSIKFYGLVLLFIVVNAFTQNGSEKSVTKTIQSKRKTMQIDSVSVYKARMKMHQFFATARVRIFDKRMDLEDSIRNLKCDTLK